MIEEMETVLKQTVEANGNRLISSAIASKSISWRLSKSKLYWVLES